MLQAIFALFFAFCLIAAIFLVIEGGKRFLALDAKPGTGKRLRSSWLFWVVALSLVIVSVIDVAIYTLL